MPQSFIINQHGFFILNDILAEKLPNSTLSSNITLNYKFDRFGDKI